MVAVLQLGLDAWLDVAGCFVLAALAAAGARVVPGRPALRGLCLAVALVLAGWGAAIGLPRALRTPAVVMDLDGVWCAPWSEGIAWRNVRAVSSREEKLEGLHWRPTDVVLPLEAEAATGPAPAAWTGVEPRWLRPLVWATRRTPSRVFARADGPVAYCNTRDLDIAHETLERLARSLVRVDRRARAEPGRREVFALCQAGGRTLRTSCIENIVLNHDACRARGADGFEACIAAFFARVDEAAEG